MRQRTTFFHKNENFVEPASLKVKDDSIVGPTVEAIREDRLTLALEELPAELQQLLRDTHELHLRWASPVAHESLGPWTSKLPPGLHVFYTPSQNQEHQNSLPGSGLCLWLKTAFGDSHCSSLEDSFTKLPSHRFTNSAAFQYYQPLDSLAHLSLYVVKTVCGSSDAECATKLGQLASAASLDFSYDTISHVVKISASWPHGRNKLAIAAHPEHRVEVGILTLDDLATLQPHEMRVTGLLTILGQDKEPSPTLFAFPARHKKAKSTFSSSFLFPTGLHPTLKLRIASSKPPVEDEFCSLHAYLTLPRAIFADRYQLGDDLFLASKNLTALRYLSQPVDLEAPAYVMKIWGSSALLELKAPEPDTKGPWTAEIPLHLRYLEPASGGYRDIQVPYPAVFWACTAADGTKFANSPFDRVSLGYDGLFGPRTMFWHVDPAPEVGNRLFNGVTVPVLDLDNSRWVSAGTSAVVLLGFAWVVYKLLAVYLRTGYRSAEPSREVEKKKQ